MQSVKRLEAESEEVTHPKYVHVQSRVGVDKSAIGHVLEAVANAESRPEVNVEAEVTGELIETAQVAVGELMAADEGWAEPDFEPHRELVVGQTHDGSSADDRGRQIGISQRARRGVELGFHPELSAQVQVQGQVAVQKGLELVKINVSQIRSKAKTGARRLDAEIASPGRWKVRGKKSKQQKPRHRRLFLTFE